MRSCLTLDEPYLHTMTNDSAAANSRDGPAPMIKTAFRMNNFLVDVL